MLKALELVGFKSFADRTRFEFPHGVTAVVGPNGSGKSNVVDAVKWVLGEQSVKSLRGKEMADVIFNGSGSRQAVNAAEATLTFDNATRILAVDAHEVHITRRVYRSGEGEYLINRQPARLRDIRDLFSGTGVATEAYSVIEQGKVDVLLQSSPRDRRAIFEEAAGISRFKAKKLESLRRLERVEQNLLRLSDIVDEVDSRLRSVRAQASKARRYKEHADRLQDLRTQVGLADWRRLSERLTQVEAELQTLSEQRGRSAAEAEILEAEALSLEMSLSGSHEELRGLEVRLAENRERITACETTIDAQRARAHEAHQEVARNLRQFAAMNLRAGDLEQQLRETSQAAAEAQRQYDEQHRRLADDESALAGLESQCQLLRARNEQSRSAALDATRSLAAFDSEAAALAAQAAANAALLARGRGRLAELGETRHALDAESVQLRRQHDELARAVDERRAEWSAAQRRLAELREEVAARLAELGELRQRHSGVGERAALLDELEQRQEGLTAGVKEVLAKVRAGEPGPFRHVRGLVADLFHVSVEMAPLIEAALGERAQFFVVEKDDELFAHFQRESYRFAGRVGFLRMQGETPAGWDAAADLEGRPGVRVRADHVVDAAAGLTPLVGRLLGRTWIVEKLSQARSLAAGDGRGQTFVTLAGEILGADGTLTVGPRQGAAGLISRRSELRALKQQIVDLAAAIQSGAGVVADLEQRIAAEAGQLETLAAEQLRAADALGEHRLQLQAVETRRKQAADLAAELEHELAAAEQQAAALAAAGAAAAERLAAARARLSEAERSSTTLAAEIVDLERARNDRQRAVSAAQVELAKSEERLGNLRARLGQFEQDQQERRRSLADCRAQLAAARRRAGDAEGNILGAESQIADLFLRKEALTAETIAVARRLDTQRERRAALVAQAQTARGAVRKLDEQLHEKQLSATEIRHERGGLADRLRDDYGIELADLEHVPTPEELHQREEIDREIAELRRKLNQIGNVNLDALAELEELDARHANLKSQFDDLTRAKDALVQIIGRINADSRRLFAETLEIVKGHFQTLFRKLFGGGQADIVLEEGVDLLDSGIEIVARPPGKEPRSISLLSGGEKTLTCVALLLAIFQYRPSPFCVLDEVDASLDEANIERFIGVLHEFLAWTQFIVVTHSKKTMTCANTLYGVTMQESGVSKRVSVRFEDVSENGEFALPDATANTSPDESEAA